MDLVPHSWLHFPSVAQQGIRVHRALPPFGQEAWEALGLQIVGRQLAVNRLEQFSRALILAAEEGIGAPGGRPLGWDRVALGIMHAGANKDGTPTVFNVVNAANATPIETHRSPSGERDEFAALHARLGGS